MSSMHLLRTEVEHRKVQKQMRVMQRQLAAATECPGGGRHVWKPVLGLKMGGYASGEKCDKCGETKWQS